MLWGIAARVCPECGKPFTVSERRFAARKAVFGCPACGTEYVGKGEDGLPEPREFACVGCGSRLGVDAMVVRPAAGARGRVEIEPIAWSSRGRLGFFRGWFGTVVEVWSSPASAARSIPRGAGWDDALLFGMVTWIISGVVGLWGVGGAVVLMFAVGVLVASAVGTRGGVVFGVLAALICVFVAVALVWVGLAVAGLAAHGVLRLTGRTRLGARGTMDAVGYSSAVALLSAAPCFGSYLVLIAVLTQCVFACVMLRARQGVAWWRGALAVAPVAALSLGSVLGPFVVAQRSMRTMHAGGWQPPVPLRSVGISGALRVSRALEAHRRSSRSELQHGYELVESGRLDAAMFVEEQLRHSGSGRTTLTPGIERVLKERWEAQRSTMPAHVIAHRVGQFVFTHHGIDPASQEQRLWVVVWAPSPVSVDVLGTPRRAAGVFDGSMVAVTRAGMPEEISPQSMSFQLEFQNALRAKEGLPALPDPFTVLEGSPAVAGGTGLGGGGSSP